ncbi:hypothetical protein BHM03_00054622 [Ensete ventricosum]|nr:hypothetical protein BHM03_00054622 [Ensete ventricosum]
MLSISWICFGHLLLPFSWQKDREDAWWWPPRDCFGDTLQIRHSPDAVLELLVALPLSVLAAAASAIIEEKLPTGMPITGFVSGRSSTQKAYPGKTTPFVILTCLVAATSGLIFGYDVGISGNPFSVPVSTTG